MVERECEISDGLARREFAGDRIFFAAWAVDEVGGAAEFVVAVGAVAHHAFVAFEFADEADVLVAKGDLFDVVGERNIDGVWHVAVAFFLDVFVVANIGGEELAPARELCAGLVKHASGLEITGDERGVGDAGDFLREVGRRCIAGALAEVAVAIASPAVRFAGEGDDAGRGACYAQPSNGR